MNITPTIQPVDSVSSHKQGTLENVTVEQITKVLGFAPNADDDPAKVKNSWAFKLNGEDAAIWDWKGSEKQNRYSYFNPKVAALFGQSGEVKTTTHLLGAKSDSNSKTLLRIPLPGGSLRVFV